MANFKKLILFVCLMESLLLTESSDSPQKWQAIFTPNKIKEVPMNTDVNVLLQLFEIDPSQISSIEVQTENPELAFCETNIKQIHPDSKEWFGNVTIKTLFLGQTKIFVQLTTVNNETQRSDNKLSVTIIRPKRIIDTLFTVSVILLVSLLYINFGAALDLSVLRGILRRPVGPTIGFCSQFILMPLLSFGLGTFLFPDSVEMQLGLFFTGVSPSGGASNIWTVLLNGNVDLSVLMTTISNFAAFAMIPLWTFTLGHVIFARGDIEVPYEKIGYFAGSLIVPLAIGVAIQKTLPRLTRILVSLLKPISTFLILFIIVFAIGTNLYLFKLFSWKIIVAGLGLPWLGYILSWFVAKLLRQSQKDALTIAVETGIQNTGIAIFLLRSCLQQPYADLTTVIPVSVAIMTPFPLFGLYLFRKVKNRANDSENPENQSIM